LRFVGARLRAAAAIGFAVAALLTVIPSAFAAPSSPARAIPSAVGAIPSAVVSAIPPAVVSAIPSALVSAISSSPAGALPALSPAAFSARATSPVSAAARVIADARSHLGARYVHGAQGPRSFDCSGLVLRVYADAGQVRRLGGWSHRSGYAIYAYARRHHLTSRRGGEPGDVVVWGGGAHVGIYLGHGKAISALLNGVRIHGIYEVTAPFTTFIHTGLSGIQTAGVTASAPKNARWTKVSARLRAHPNVGAHTIRTLSAGTRVLVQRSIRDSHRRVWYEVRVGGRTGWVAGWLTER
jgi:cell wall-associated NlpC family hydrolase